MVSQNESLVQGAQNLVEQGRADENKPSRAQRLRQTAGRAALSLGLVAGGAVTGAVGSAIESHPFAAYAVSDDYPDAGKVCVAGGPSSYGKVSGTGYWCPNYSWGDFIYNQQGQVIGNNQDSPRGYAYRNCTDWTAWRVKELTGVTLSVNMGNSQDWDNNAPSKGYVVDGTPEVGDIAQWEAPSPTQFGHVAVVEGVNVDGTVNVSEYNKSQNGTFGTRNSVTADHYIDVNGPNGGSSPAHGDATMGAYDPATAKFYITNAAVPGGAEASPTFGNTNWIPLSGDWDGNGTETLGAYDPSTATFYLRNATTQGNADMTIQYGNVNWKPVVGDWDGNGTDTLGSYDPTTAKFYLRNANTAGNADHVYTYGNPGWQPLAGDWNGDATDTLGAYDPSVSKFYLTNATSPGNAEMTPIYGNANWVPVVGDWDGDGDATIGVYDPSTATFYLRNSNDQGNADHTYTYGLVGWKPVPGDWDGA